MSAIPPRALDNQQLEAPFSVLSNFVYYLWMLRKQNGQSDLKLLVMANVVSQVIP